MTHGKSIKNLTHNNQAVAKALLRAGLGFVFLYAALSSFVQPFVWIGYIPGFLLHFAPTNLLLEWLALYELLLAIALLSGKYTRYIALLCAATLGVIVLTNLSQLITTFRDIGLLFMALTLFVLEG